MILDATCLAGLPGKYLIILVVVEYQALFRSSIYDTPILLFMRARIDGIKVISNTSQSVCYEYYNQSPNDLFHITGIMMGRC